MRQKRRKYINRVEVLINDAVSDGFGGNTLAERSLSFSWANIRSLDTKNASDLGLDLKKTAIVIKTRFRSDLDYNQPGIFFKYKELCFMPVQITNEHLNDEEIKIIAYQS